MAEEQLEHRVLPLELFFDLVFVFAITQVTGFLSHDPTWKGLVEGIALLGVLWWAWSCYAWLENTAASDEGAVRLVMLSAMAAMLIVSLAVPGAFTDDALIFAVAYLVVRVLHVGMYWVISREDPELRRLTWRLAASMLPAAALLVVAGLVHGAPRAAAWILALAVDYGGLALAGTAGWRVQAGHFAERHGGFVIIALGESIVAVGVGASGLELDAGIIVAALLGVVVAGALWWAYFDVVAAVGERELTLADSLRRARLARDSYTYLHLPMVAGIVLLALGIKKTLGHMEDELALVPAVCLCGGAGLYLLALSAFKRRNIGSWNRPRLVAAALLAASVPLATGVPALVALALVALITVALIVVEVRIYAEARHRIRHG
jgi:low temperature requirement protein LtrA